MSQVVLTFLDKNQFHKEMVQEIFSYKMVPIEFRDEKEFHDLIDQLIDEELDAFSATVGKLQVSPGTLFLMLALYSSGFSTMLKITADVYSALSASHPPTTEKETEIQYGLTMQRKSTLAIHTALKGLLAKLIVPERVKIHLKSGDSSDSSSSS